MTLGQQYKIIIFNNQNNNKYNIIQVTIKKIKINNKLKTKIKMKRDN